MIYVLRQGWLRLLLAITLVIAGVVFASHSVRDGAADPQLAEYLALGGSLDDMCLTGDGAHAHAECPFCREVDAFALADQPTRTAFIARIHSAALEPRAPLPPRVEVTRRPPQRAPPTA